MLYDVSMHALGHIIIINLNYSVIRHTVSTVFMLLLRFIVHVCFIMPTCSIEGIVVAMENEEVILEAWEQEEQIRIEKVNKVCFVSIVGVH